MSSSFSLGSAVGHKLTFCFICFILSVWEGGGWKQLSFRVRKKICLDWGDILISLGLEKGLDPSTNLGMAVRKTPGSLSAGL